MKKKTNNIKQATCALYKLIKINRNEKKKIIKLLHAKIERKKKLNPEIKIY